MGCISCKPSPPSKYIILPMEEVRTIIMNHTNLTYDRIELTDEEYVCYSLDDLKRFLSNDNTNCFKYEVQNFDCDDYSKVLMGREREWMKKLDVKAGSVFGIIHGDIRKDSNTPRFHAMNFIIDDTKTFYLVESQRDGEIYKPVNGSNFTFVLS